MIEVKVKKQLQRLEREHRALFVSCDTIIGLLLCRLRSAGELTVNQLAQIIHEVKDDPSGS